MSHFRYILAHPLFARWFAAVHPFFWPVLYWQMSRHFRRAQESGYENALVQIHWWGAITIVHLGDKRPDPAAYKPLARTFRPLTDASWGSDLPAGLDSLTLAAQRALILPCASGGLRGQEIVYDFPSKAPKGSEGALAFQPDTS